MYILITLDAALSYLTAHANKYISNIDEDAVRRSFLFLLSFKLGLANQEKRR